MGIFGKTNKGLFKTRNKMTGAIDDMLDAFDSFEDDLYTELEEILVMSDVGVNTAVAIVEELKSRVKSEKISKTAEVKKELQNIIAEMLDGGEDMGLVTIPSVILVIGVNGAGKTTTIGKMAAMYKAEGKKVILGAADTFRAAAIDQLDVWAQRAGVEIIKHKEGADPAAVIYDTIQAGISRDCDIIICDTAGRLHNKKNLMDELNKIYRVMDKELPYADREVLLVLDATTGQNAVNQANEFMKIADLTGIVLTKLDGTARGGVVLSIKNDLKIPVKFIGVGEGIDDLQPFNPSAFARSLFEDVSEEEIKKLEEGDSLSELVNSEDYQNYTPVEDGESDSEDIRSLIESVFGEITDERGAEESVSQGQEDRETSEEGTEIQEENIETETEEYPTAEQIGDVEEQSNIPDGNDKEEKTDEILMNDSFSVETEIISTERQQESVCAKEPETVAEEEQARSEDDTSDSQIANEPVGNTEEVIKDTVSDKPASASKPEKKERRGFFGLFNRHS